MFIFFNCTKQNFNKYISTQQQSLWQNMRKSLGLIVQNYFLVVQKLRLHIYGTLKAQIISMTLSFHLKCNMLNFAERTFTKYRQHNVTAQLFKNPYICFKNYTKDFQNSTNLCKCACMDKRSQILYQVFSLRIMIVVVFVDKFAEKKIGQNLYHIVEKCLYQQIGTGQIINILLRPSMNTCKILS
eukprot:TRINITY_DN1935_c1_g1_i14.p2 TRINITY_DN1935_c1_g1~~TRINITY_DN1935_c1_g1_i14.p2  ORF type:complete len:185 (+),score=-6.71 TRINITY_DN1935_c1_g1_i14:493-1047(+)